MADPFPPICTGKIIKGRITSDADIFELFAKHYLNMMHNKKKKTPLFLQYDSNALRRSNRLAGKHLNPERNAMKRTRNPKFKIERPNSVLSDTQSQDMFTVMSFADLKLRRRSEFLCEATRKQRSLPIKQPIADEIIEIEDDSSDSDSAIADIQDVSEISHCDIDSSTMSTQRNTPIPMEIPVTQEDINTLLFTETEINQVASVPHFDPIVGHFTHPILVPGMVPATPSSTVSSQYMEETFDSNNPYPMDLLSPHTLTTGTSTSASLSESAPSIPLEDGLPTYSCRVRMNRMMPSQFGSGRTIRSLSLLTYLGLESCAPIEECIDLNDNYQFETPNPFRNFNGSQQFIPRRFSESIPAAYSYSQTEPVFETEGEVPYRAESFYEMSQVNNLCRTFMNSLRNGQNYVTERFDNFHSHTRVDQDDEVVEIFSSSDDEDATDTRNDEEIEDNSDTAENYDFRFHQETSTRMRYYQSDDVQDSRNRSSGNLNRRTNSRRNHSSLEERLNSVIYEMHLTTTELYIEIGMFPCR